MACHQQSEPKSIYHPTDGKDVELRAFAEATPLFEGPGGGLQSHESFSKDVFPHPSPMSPCCRRKTLRENFKESAKMVICSTKLNILLLCIPLAIVAVIFKWRHGWIFLFSLLGMAPLAERLGFVTEWGTTL
jgi:hypothetical protein